MLPLLEGAISGYGSWSVPVQGTHVFLFFEHGNILQPRYFAASPGVPTEAPDTNEGFNDPDGNYPEQDKLNEPDFNRLARNENTSETIVQAKNDGRTTGVSTAGGGS